MNSRFCKAGTVCRIKITLRTPLLKNQALIVELQITENANKISSCRLIIVLIS